MTDFKYIFQKTWDRIPTSVNPTPGNAFLHYLRAFKSDITTTILTMTGDTLPRVLVVHINRSLVYMAQPRAHAFVAFNGENPLLLAQRHDIPIASLKSI